MHVLGEDKSSSEMKSDAKVPGEELITIYPFINKLTP